MTVDEAFVAGPVTVKQRVAMIEREHGAEVATAFAAAAISELRNFIFEKRGARATYDLFAGLADEIVEQVGG